MSKKILKLKSFWKNKKVFITGHTGFKGSWLTIFLHLLGAKVYGYSLKQEKYSLYNFAKIEKLVTKSIIGDIRDYNKLKQSIKKSHPDFLFHMAAQPLVRYSYDFPKYTYEANTFGTLNILNILKEIKFLKKNIFSNIKNKKKLSQSINKIRPEVLFHLAAQPLVLEGYKNPIETFDTNIIGTINVLNAMRSCKSLKSAVIITTDKVYKINKNDKLYSENDELGGIDPYSASKVCGEILTSTYTNLFLK